MAIFANPEDQLAANPEQPEKDTKPPLDTKVGERKEEVTVPAKS